MSKYSVVVVELDDALPRLDPSCPNLLVALTIQSPEEKFEQLKKGKGKRQKWAWNRAVKLRIDLAPERKFPSRKKAEAERQKVMKTLKEDGFTVNQDRGIWKVYVIELSKPEGPEKWVYVGSTSQTPEERLLDHLDGKRNKRGPTFSRKVHKFGVGLLYDLFPEKNIFLTREAAEKAEKLHAENLKANGFMVEQG